MEAIIKINMFTKDQEVYIIDKESETGFISYRVPFADIARSLMDFQDLHTIHLYGNEQYLKEIKNNIQKLEMNKYNKNDIKICINE